jgi:hypothetical protein
MGRESKPDLEQDTTSHQITLTLLLIVLTSQATSRDEIRLLHENKICFGDISVYSDL